MKYSLKIDGQNPGVVPQAGKGPLCIPPLPSCSQHAPVLPGMCAASSFVSLQSAGAEEEAALRRETGNNYLQPPEPALPFPAG